MNIYEALEAGKRKATLPEWQGKCFVSTNTSEYFEWKTSVNYFGVVPYVPPMYRKVEQKFLKRNDWVPYVEVKKDWAKPFGITANFSLWENWFKIYFELRKVGFSEAYVKDFLIPPPGNVPRETKTNKVTVFENIKWKQVNYMPVIYPVIQQGNLSFFKMKSLLNKPPMKMTLEWTEEIKPNG